MLAVIKINWLSPLLLCCALAVSPAIAESELLDSTAMDPAFAELSAAASALASNDLALTDLQGVCLYNGVRVRGRPELNSPLLFSLFKQNEFAVIGRTEEQVSIGDDRDHWYKIVVPDGTEGWIFGAFIAVEKPLAPGIKGMINNYHINVRASFATVADKVSRLNRGREFEMISMTDRKIQVESSRNYWFKLEVAADIYGWVFGDFIDIHLPFDSTQATGAKYDSALVKMQVIRRVEVPASPEEPKNQRGLRLKVFRLGN